MDELIARIEAASRPDRELDAMVFAALGWSPVSNPHNAMGLLNRWQREGAMTGHEGPPNYTSSIEAALTLVPEGFDWTLGHTNGGLTIHAEVGGRGDEYMRFGATPALALCAAALRARAA